MISPPKGTKSAGRRLWRSVTDEYDLSGAELEILGQAVRVADVLDDLAAIVAAEGVVENGTGRTTSGRGRAEAGKYCAGATARESQIAGQRRVCPYPAPGSTWRV
jgi:hypothetical protein